jgi:hypothetical protein
MNVLQRLARTVGSWFREVFSEGAAAPQHSPAHEGAGETLAIVRRNISSASIELDAVIARAGRAEMQLREAELAGSPNLELLRASAREQAHMRDALAGEVRKLQMQLEAHENALRALAERERHVRATEHAQAAVREAQRRLSAESRELEERSARLAVRENISKARQELRSGKSS